MWAFEVSAGSRVVFSAPPLSASSVRAVVAQLMWSPCIPSPDTTTPTWVREGRPHTTRRVLRTTEDQHRGAKYNRGGQGGCLIPLLVFLNVLCFFHPLLKETINIPAPKLTSASKSLKVCHTPSVSMNLEWPSHMFTTVPCYCQLEMLFIGTSLLV